ncbi:MAG TPA: ACT domain-containing protein, partial [Thermoanaerobaculia bacterium]|nr:ACT domain-containing protein [Thermoanaerobaculia bacterium]
WLCGEPFLCLGAGLLHDGEVMAKTALISILCEDRTGLIAAITGRLFDLGANLGDTTFAVLGTGAEFTTVCEVPEDLSLGQVEDELKDLAELRDARLTVTDFSFKPVHGPSGHITHRIEITGPDSPGLIARLSEAFVGYGANIVRMNSERVPGSGGINYTTRIAVSIPPGKEPACLATVGNTAAELKLSCRWDKAG